MKAREAKQANGAADPKEGVECVFTQTRNQRKLGYGMPAVPGLVFSLFASAGAGLSRVRLSGCSDHARLHVWTCSLHRGQAGQD